MAASANRKRLHNNQMGWGSDFGWGFGVWAVFDPHNPNSIPWRYGQNEVNFHPICH